MTSITSFKVNRVTHFIIPMFLKKGLKTSIVDYRKLFQSVRYASYIQGQSPEPKIREYFYYIDHQGMLFLDDSRMKNFTSCFKEKKFLEFFFIRLRSNKTGRYESEFPFVSLCGPERNFVRCDDKPIVFTKLVESGDKSNILHYAHTDLLKYAFNPEKLCMVPETGRVYHPSPPKIYPVGLVQSKLAIELSQHFRFENGEDKPPTQFEWGGTVYQTDNEWYKNIL